LPFEENSLDLVVLPHSLELNLDPHTTLREVERVLVPEGKVVICCLNPASLWGLRQRRANVYRRLGFGELYLPDAGEFIGYWRLRDWLRLLSFEVETSSFGCYRPAFSSEKWLERFSWMDAVGERSWPIFGAPTSSWPSSACAASSSSGRHGRRPSAWRPLPCRSPIAAGAEPANSLPSNEPGRDLHGRGLQGQSRPRRLGRAPALRRHAERAVRRRTRHHQQPHGADGRDPGAGGP
jgi:hypothetical protein